MMFYRRMNMIKSSKHAVGSFMHLLLSSQFVRENSLVNRPHASLWLGKTYVLHITSLLNTFYCATVQVFMITAFSMSSPVELFD